MCIRDRNSPQRSEERAQLGTGCAAIASSGYSPWGRHDQNIECWSAHPRETASAGDALLCSPRQAYGYSEKLWVRNCNGGQPGVYHAIYRVWGADMREHSSKYVERWRSPSDLGYAAGCAQRGIARDQSGTLVVYSVAILLEATAGQSACRGMGYVSRVPTEAAAAAGAMHIQRAHVHLSLIHI